MEKMDITETRSGQNHCLIIFTAKNNVKQNISKVNLQQNYSKYRTWNLLSINKNLCDIFDKKQSLQTAGSKTISKQQY